MIILIAAITNMKHMADIATATGEEEEEENASNELNT